MIAWLAVVLLGLTGRRRTAAAIASISLTLACCWPCWSCCTQPSSAYVRFPEGFSSSCLR